MNKLKFVTNVHTNVIPVLLKMNVKLVLETESRHQLVNVQPVNMMMDLTVLTVTLVLYNV
jgi:hypothetical protein